VDVADAPRWSPYELCASWLRFLLIAAGGAFSSWLSASSSTA
jgi:hypothetical protein